MARRLQAMGAAGYEEGFRVKMHPERLNQPKRRRKPTMYFVNSMSDLFHEEVSNDFLESVLRVMEETPRHTYQVLTKRADRMAEWFSHRMPPHNLWLGVSVENRKHGLPRIELLRRVPAAVRFLSVEPLLEDLGELDLRGIDWVIVGGESGHKARPMQPEWVRRVRDAAIAQGVSFFFKQWGTWGPDGKRRNKKANGRLLDGRIWDTMPIVSGI